MNREFWIGQILVVICTIIGVYLASHEGYRIALEFDDVQGNIDNYHLRRSLRDELSDNIVAVKNYIDESNAETGRMIKGKYPRLQLHDFVWSAMKESAVALETPSEFLSATRRFYAQVNERFGEIYRQIDGNKHRLIDRSRFITLIGDLREQAIRLETHLLPKMDADLERLHRLVIDQGAEL